MLHRNLGRVGTTIQCMAMRGHAPPDVPCPTTECKRRSDPSALAGRDRSGRSPRSEAVSPALASCVSQAAKRVWDVPGVCRISRWERSWTTPGEAGKAEPFLRKSDDREARRGDPDVTDLHTTSVASGRTTDFQALQNRMNRGHATEVVYFIFDLPYSRGRDLRRTPIEERKRILRGLLERAPDDLERSRPPFRPPPTGTAARGVHWVEPALVAEVRFTGWTGEGRLRHPSFLGLRSDKPPGEVTRDMPKRGPDPPKPPPDRDRVAGVRLSNADRVLYPEQGVTKLGLATYYERVASRILPHLEHRPISLVRCPRGHEEQCFYQKHLKEGFPDPVRGIAIEESDASKLYVAVDDLAGLVTLVQFGVLELHPWGSREDRLDRPDRIVVDLDPGPGVEWPAIPEAARFLRHFLGDLGLESWVRTTGGKGLHVVAPIARRSEGEEVKEFARDVARHMERHDPAAFVSTSSKAKRKGRIYVDYLRNGRGATAIASYSTRARPGAPVATPLRWNELGDLRRPDQYTVANIPARLASLDGDPWEGFFESRQVLTQRMKEAVAAD